MALPPCQCPAPVPRADGRLSCQPAQRSCDMFIKAVQHQAVFAADDDDRAADRSETANLSRPAATATVYDKPMPNLGCAEQLSRAAPYPEDRDPQGRFASLTTSTSDYDDRHRPPHHPHHQGAGRGLKLTIGTIVPVRSWRVNEMEQDSSRNGLSRTGARACRAVRKPMIGVMTFPRRFQVNLIWAEVDDKDGRPGAIGSTAVRLWHLPEDMKRFKELTVSHPVIMGRRTWESLNEVPSAAQS